MENKESRRVKMTKLLLKEALIELMEIRPISKITIKDICETADLNRSTFYAYYTDQYFLLKEIENDIIAETPSINLYKDEPLESILSEFFAFIDDNKQIYKILFENSESVFRDRILAKVFNRPAENGNWVGDMDLNDNMHIRMLMCAFGGLTMVEKWIFGEFKTSPSHLARVLAEFISRT